jgi:ribonuclease HII
MQKPRLTGLLLMVTGSGVLIMERLFPDDDRDLLLFERLAANRGFVSVAGVDEAGRGALAGPVVAAAVILPSGDDFSGIDDSKKLSPLQRERFHDVIMARATAVGVGFGDHRLIDRINILQSTLHAMADAVRNLPAQPDFLLIDGISAPALPIPCRTIKKGDSASISIAAASIIAKVVRDRVMLNAAKTYPGYGFESHKGYGSAQHLAAIAALGPCPIHRLTFRGVREFSGCGDGSS